MGTSKEESQRRMKVVVESYKEKKSRSEIAEKMGVSVYAVEYYIRKAKDRGMLPKTASLPSNVKITKKEEQSILYLYISGWSKKEIADKMSFSYTAICKHLKDCGVTTRDSRYDIELLRKVADDYNCGYDNNEIAMRIGINKKQVFYAMTKASKLGLLKSFPGRGTKFKSTADMVNRGYTIKEIAEKMNCGEQAIYRRINTAIQQGLLDPDVHIDTGHRKYTKKKRIY